MSKSHAVPVLAAANAQALKLMGVAHRLKALARMLAAEKNRLHAARLSSRQPMGKSLRRREPRFRPSYAAASPPCLSRCYCKAIYLFASIVTS